MGCAACDGDDASTAWEEIRTARQLAALVEESHYSVRLKQHGCGQRFVVIFTERIDWVDGNDPHDFRAVPITEAEHDALAAQGDRVAVSAIEALGSARRYLVRSWPADAGQSTGWRTGGLWIGPHD